MNKKPLFTIVTPTWNRCNYLNRVYEGLKKQTLRDFEWILCDDGSTDDTPNIIKSIVKDSTFPITVIKSDIRIGKARMDNMAISAANGDLIIFNDSDDYLVDKALECIYLEWKNISNNNLVEKYIGLTALCSTIEGVPISSYPEDFPIDTSWNYMRQELGVKGDMIYVVRADIMKKNLFPEVDYYIPESVIWSKLGGMKTRVIRESLLIKEYQSENCVSFSGKMQYTRGYAHAISEGRKIQSGQHRKNMFDSVYEMVTYVRYSIHGGISTPSMINTWPDNISKFLIFFIYPISYLLSLRDLYHKKVVKTHIGFDLAVKNAVITKEIFR
jgi:glycosyltransferase involved in cell wall biosynthesis